jgi:hypothetical protein
VGAAAGGVSYPLLAAPEPAEGPSMTIRLTPQGSARDLPARWLGYNTPANYDIPIEDPAARAVITELAPHLVRFPGGTTANYYNWRTGQLDFGRSTNGSVYRRFLQRYAGPASVRLHPKGVFAEQYVELCAAMAAECILVPNLETSSVEDQAAWFGHLHAKGVVPRRIEMGNEFYLALLMDPETLRVFPDGASTLDRTKAYLDAIKDHLPPDALIAVQAAGSKYHDPFGKSAHPREVRERRWDADMAPAPWFHAVTTHLYPTVEGSAGEGSLARLDREARPIFAAVMARSDEGYERSLSDTIARMPGKEIWITEWGAFEPAATLGAAQAEFNGLWLHVLARCLFAMLRFPQVTVSTLHALFFSGNTMSAFRRAASPGQDGSTSGAGAGSSATGAYVAINGTELYSWFLDASRGPGATYQRMTAEGATTIRSDRGTLPGEAFLDVEAGLFARGSGRTLLVQNGWSSPKQVDLSGLVGSASSLTADIIKTDLTESYQVNRPSVRTMPAGPVIDLPAYSIARVRWMA